VISRLRPVIVGCSSLCDGSPWRRWGRQLLFEKHSLELPEIAIIEKSAGHVRQDLRGADRVKLMPDANSSPRSAPAREALRRAWRRPRDSITTTLAVRPSGWW
jgi:hypothetical protein